MNPLRFLVVALFLSAFPLHAADFVWIEGESLANPPAGFKKAGWGNKQYLSGETWLFANIEGKDAEALPAAGIVISFPFSTAKDGGQNVWARLGYEFARSPFLWRIDGGDWTTAGSEKLTTDLMSLADWTEVAWLNLGKTKLAAGNHALEIKFERRLLPNKKQPERILAGFDCFCITPETFIPNGPHKPDADWKTDRDRAAEKSVLEFAKISGPRSTFPLNGTWQIARWDEGEIKDRDQPVKELPADLKSLPWKGIAVPGNRDKERPDLLYCHRFLYRTKLKLGGDAGQSAILRFPSTAMLGSVFVNGQYCGGNDTPCSAWDADITPALKFNEENELIVAIKDCYYALETTGEGKSPRTMFNYPADWFYSKGSLGATRFADFPVLFRVHGAGIFETPELIVTDGPVSVADVFAKPSVAKKELELEITLHNSSDKAVTVAIANDIVPLGDSMAAKTFASKSVDVPARGDTTVNIVEKWENPKRWWPDEPRQYEALTKLQVGDKVVDLAKTKFGFREWGWTGQAITLNGVPWHFHADLLHNGSLHGKDLDKVAADWKKSGINTVRYWGDEPWVGNSQRETLDWYDKIGMPIRRTGTFDGEVASYQLVEQKNGKSVARKALFDHWIKQYKAMVKAEHNHPSVFMWSIENEVTFINARNIGWLDQVEPEMRRATQEVMKLDPTRPAMIDGGDALRDRSLPIYGDHYNETNFRHYPSEAYTMDIAFSRHKTDGGWTPWAIGDDRPLFLGETYFANGFPPAAFSAVMGEAAFLGRSAAEPGVDLFARMLAEGYRWHGIAGFHFWFAGTGPNDSHYKAFQPVCAFVREWDSAFAAGSEVKRTIKVFNDTHYDDPIEFSWSFVDPQTAAQLASGKRTLNVKPGSAEELTITLPIPAAKSRQMLALIFSCKQKQMLFEDSKIYHVMVPNDAKPTDPSIHVLDPNGAVKARLKQRQIEFADVESFEKIPNNVKVLVVGPNALTPKQATDPRWQALAATGARIIVLDQDYPLHFQACPADLVVTPYGGHIAFPENLQHPLLAGLDTPDFFCWSGDQLVYRNAYRKATRGARSLLQCDDELGCSALAECPINSGLLLLCQARVGTKLASDPVAQRLFDNMLNYAAAYKPVARSAASVFPEGDRRLQLLESTGLKFSSAPSIEEALKDDKIEIIIADAAPAALAKLATSPTPLRKFLERGGQLMLWDVTEKGLRAFDEIVGVDHIMRPFKLERVSLPAKRDPLIAGLSNRDVALEGTEKIYPWAGDRYPANDTFTNIVDLDDIAPFGKSDKSEFGWSQMTNGLTTADSWKFIFYYNLKEQGDKPYWEAVFPKEEEITGFSIIINTDYNRINKLQLIFDDKIKESTTLDLKTDPQLRQNFDSINNDSRFTLPPRRFKKIALKPLSWDGSSKTPVIGVDNIWIRVRRDEDYHNKVVPLLNIGGLVRYKFGKGSIILNQLRIPPTEPNPINADKKQSIVSTLLRNMGTTFAAEKTLIAGANLNYRPIPLGDKCNQYLTGERGWIAGQPDMSQFPVGDQKLAGVSYTIRDFKTSPLPSCIMLAGPGTKADLGKSVTGIAVDEKVDALFFLHAFRRVKDWKAEGDKKEPPPLFVYVVKYADGKSVEVPVRYERGVGPWITAQPSGVAEAAVAWNAPLPKDPTKNLVVYQMMWKNPRPGEAIKSIDVKFDDKVGNAYGVPIVLGITAAKAE